MNKKERYKKLMRKVRKAKRQGEPYEQWLDELDRLDVFLAEHEKGWVAGGHLKYKEGSTDG